MKQLALFFIITLFALPTLSQSTHRVQVNGRVSDKETTNWLSLATVSCLNAKDSSTIEITLTDESGRFKIDSLLTGNYILTISFIGYNSLRYPVTTTASQTSINLGNISIQKTGLTLTQINIVQSISPAKIKKDTIEFNASYFKPKDYDLVEDLLKKIPGIQIDNSGIISINGEIIKTIMVDGRRIFGSEDLRSVSQNLLASIIDKVQLIEQKKDKATSIVADGPKIEKVINITTKKNIQDLINGQLTTAIGTSERFGAKTNLNQFNKNQQIILIANGNNINGLLDNKNMGNNGIEKKWEMGINYNKDINTKLTLSTNYIMQLGENTYERRSSKRTINNDAEYYYNQQSVNKTKSLSHRIYAQLEYKIDTLNRIIITNQLGITNIKNLLENQYESLSTNSIILNNGLSHEKNRTTAKSASTNISFEKKYKKVGRSTNMVIGYAQNNHTKNENNESSSFYNNNTGESVRDTINTNAKQSGNVNQLFLSLAHTEPISRKQFLLFAYGEDYMNRPLIKSAFNYNYLTHSYNIPNDSLSSNLKYTSFQRFGKIGIANQTGKIEYTISLAGIISGMRNLNRLSTESIKMWSSNFLPNLFLNYNLTSSKALKFVYYRNIRYPEMNELQSIVDNSDPMYIKKGNPELKPSSIESLELSFSNFNQSNLSLFAISFFGEYIKNQIVTGIWFDSLGRQTLQPLNLSGASKVGINVNSSTSLKNSMGTIRSNTTINYNNDLNSLNSAVSNYKTISINQMIVYNYNTKNIFDLYISGNIIYNHAQYDSDYLKKNTTIRYNWGLDATLNLLAGISINSTINYEWLDGNITNYNIKKIMLNANISKVLFRKKQGLIKLQAFDILKQNIQVSRNIGVNYIEDTQTNVLHRFFLLRFMYLIGKK